MAVTPSRAKRAHAIVDDAAVRLPHTVVGSGATGAPVGGARYLTPLAVSKATTDIGASTPRRISSTRSTSFGRGMVAVAK